MKMAKRPVPLYDFKAFGAVSYTHLDVYKRQDSEYAGPEPTLENTSYYVKEPDGTLYFYCGNTKIKMTEHLSLIHI